MNFTSRKYIFRKTLFLTGEDELLCFLEIEFINGVEEATVCFFDFNEDVVVWP